MIVPRYWAEARAQDRRDGRQVTVRRFGWSNTSLDDATAMAEARAAAALGALRRGERAERSEPKVPYNGADGVPIREEIVSEHGDVVVTRNSYGARCLNTPRVLIADVDHAPPGTDPLALASGVVLAVAGLAVGRAFLESWGLGAIFALVGAPLGEAIASRVRAVRTRRAGGPLALALARVAAFVDAHPHWHIRAYETPKGARLIVVHDTFDPLSAIVHEFFVAIGADRQYARMCRRQRCFRARLTAKPWRIGIARHMKPRPGVWPVSEHRRAERSAFIDDYETRAAGFAACRFVRAFGNEHVVDDDARAVVALHDEACRADSALPLA